jgi:hypothetical protein
MKSKAGWHFANRWTDLLKDLGENQVLQFRNRHGRSFVVAYHEKDFGMDFSEHMPPKWKVRPSLVRVIDMDLTPKAIVCDLKEHDHASD